MEMLVQKIHEAVSKYCQKQAEEAQKGYAQAAWFKQNGQEQLTELLNQEDHAAWLKKGFELGYDLDDVEVIPEARAWGGDIWYLKSGFELGMSAYGKHVFAGPFHSVKPLSFPQNSELPKAFIVPFLERERKEAEEKRALQIAEEDDRKRKQAEREKEKIEALRKKQFEKNAWIAEFGSDYLRRATALDYNCQRQYVTERAAHEHPDYSVDFDDNAEWNDRACPSMDALGEVESLVAAGVDAEVVWLTSPVYGFESYEDEANWEPREAIVIRNYLGKYYLAKEI